MTGPEGPRCRHCQFPIQGIAESRYGVGWMHTGNRREKAADGHLAEPHTLDDLNARHNANQARSRAARRLTL